MPKFPKNKGFKLRSKHGGPFKLMGVSPIKQKNDPYTKEDEEFLKEQREERVKSTDYLTKTPVGPVATEKKDKKTDVPLSPGFEDPVKIQKIQREGLVPGSQKFVKKKLKKQ